MVEIGGSVAKVHLSKVLIATKVLLPLPEQRSSFVKGGKQS